MVQIGKGVRQGYILPLCLFNLYAKYIMRKAGLEEPQAAIIQNEVLFLEVVELLKVFFFLFIYVFCPINWMGGIEEFIATNSISAEGVNQP